MTLTDKDRVMNGNGKLDEMDGKTEEALRHFRASVYSWSDREMQSGRLPKSVAMARRGNWNGWRSVAGWAMACVLLMAAVGIPLDVRHHEQVEAAARMSARVHQQQVAALEAQRKASEAITDEELLKDVDNDIAQATPDAMEPLAQMMQGPATR